MKNLKIKLGLFSLLSLLIFSIFISSCEQTNLPIDNTFSEEENSVFITMEDFTEMLAKNKELSAEDISKRLSQLNETEFTEFLNQSSSGVSDRSSCGAWKTHFICSWEHNFWWCNLDVMFEARWCGPPSYGAWEFRNISCNYHCA